MRDDDMLRLSLDCASHAVRGEEYSPALTAGVAQIMDAHAIVLKFSWQPRPNGPVADVTVDAPGYRGPREDLLRAGGVAARHPSFSNLLSSSVNRVSDQVCLPRFWETDVWDQMHGHNNGRFPASVLLSCHPRSVMFLGLHRAHRDFSDEDMQLLECLEGPLRPALSFRQAWERASLRLQQSLGCPPDVLTRREAQVIALVARGWTNRRISHMLGVTERTVRKHIGNSAEKLGARNRTEAATRWFQASSLIPPGRR